MSLQNIKNIAIRTNVPDLLEECRRLSLAVRSIPMDLDEKQRPEELLETLKSLPESVNRDIAIKSTKSLMHMVKTLRLVHSDSLV